MQQQDADDLTPLDARNSLLLERFDTGGKASAMSNESSYSLYKDPVRSASPDRYVAPSEGYRPPMAPSGGPVFRPMTPTMESGIRHNLDPDPGSYGRGPAFPPVASRYGASYNGGGYRDY